MRLRKTKTPERLVKDDVKRICQYLGILIFPIIGSLGQRPGMPDYWGIYKGQALAIECKAKGGRQSDYQKQVQMEVEGAGGIYILAYSGADVAKAVGAPMLLED